MHKEFKTINAMLPDLFLRKVLFSNGMLIDKKLLKGLHIDELQISIDGLEEAHDSLRGKGSYQKAMEAIGLCMNMGFEVSVSTMVHAKNLGDFDDMERLFREMGIRDWTVDVPCVSGRLINNADLQLPPERGGKYLKYGFGEGLHGGGEGFGCGLHLMSVMADGRIAKCTFYADKFVGTVADGLSACWKRIAPVRLGDLACDCAHLESCRGGCRYRAELLGGPSGKDLYRCSLYDIIESRK
jgi:radical SAM protein with 4Fe4S-binding SPASM domain